MAVHFNSRISPILCANSYAICTINPMFLHFHSLYALSSSIFTCSGVHVTFRACSLSFFMPMIGLCSIISSSTAKFNTLRSIAKVILAVRVPLCVQSSYATFKSLRHRFFIDILPKGTPSMLVFNALFKVDA